MSPPSSPTSTTSAPKPARVGRERRPRRAGCRPRETTSAARALAGAERQVGGRGDRRRALVERGVGDRQPGQLGDRGLELEHHLQPALGDLGLIRRVGGEELRARDDRVDQRRDVVVVHPGAEEAELRVGVGVARGERARGGRRPRSPRARPGARAAGRGAARRGCRRTARRSSRRRSRRASPRGRRRWRRCSGSHGQASDRPARPSRAGRSSVAGEQLPVGGDVHQLRRPRRRR